MRVGQARDSVHPIERQTVEREARRFRNSSGRNRTMARLSRRQAMKMGAGAAAGWGAAHVLGGCGGESPVAPGPKDTAATWDP